MHYEIYTELNVTDDLSIFDFTSIGKRGNIHKRIVFMPTERPDIYNLAFGHVGTDDHKTNDNSVSNNGDRNKILATVAFVVEAYTKRYPDRWVFFRGNTKEKTRLYRMAIGLNYNELSRKFDIYVHVGGDIVPFANDLEIVAFFVKRKG